MKSALVVAITGTAMLLAPAAQASIIFAISPSSGSFAAGSNGDSFDVVLENFGPAFSANTFSFEISTTNPLITLTGANFSTAPPYIFNGDSLDQMFPPLNTSSGQTLDASDLTADLLDVQIPANSTVGLGHILFNISPSATGGFGIIFTGGTNVNQLSNANGSIILPNQVTGGNFTIRAATPSTPEPATGALVTVALTGLLAGLRYRRRS
jgi:hypothetical protein